MVAYRSSLIVKVLNKLSLRFIRSANKLPLFLFSQKTGTVPKKSFSIKLLNRLPTYLSAEPYEVWITFGLFFGGIAALVNPRASGPLGRVLPNWEVYSWGICLIIGSLLTMYGLIASSFSKNEISHRLNREWERLGQLILGIATALWAAIVFTFGAVAISSGLLILFLSFVSFTRAIILKAIEVYTPLSRVDAIKTFKEVNKKLKEIQKDSDL